MDKGSYGILIADENAVKEEKKPVEENNKTLLDYQSQEDSPEEVKKLMSTKVSDISKDSFKVKYDSENENIFVPLESGDIIYTDIYFDVSSFDNLTALSTYKAIADIYDENLSNDIDYYTGGFSTEVTTLQKKDEYRPVLLFRIKCLKENFEKSLDIFKSVICQNFNDKDRILRLVSEAKQNIRSGYIEGGNSKAIGEALGQVSTAYYWDSRAKGTDYYTYLSNEVDIIANDVSMVKSVFNRGNAFYAVAGAKEDKEKIISLVEDALSVLNSGGSLNVISSDILGNSKGIIIDGNVNFNAVAFEMDCSDGISRVVQQIISREYLWDKVRLEGGAYGGGCSLGKHYSYMYSYRDPNFEKTYDVFKNAGKYIAESKYTQSDIDRFIIGTINDIDKPIKKHLLTRIAMRKKFNSETKETVLKRREQILSATPKAIADFGNNLANVKINGFCTVGLEKNIKNCQIFKELYRID